MAVYIATVKSRNINMVNLFMEFYKNIIIDFLKQYGNEALLEAIDGNDIDMVKKVMDNTPILTADSTPELR